MGKRGPRPDLDAPARLRARHQARKRDNRERYTAYQRDAYRKRVYGLTPAQFDELLSAQDGCCAICGRDLVEGGWRIHVDHDHDRPGTHRGILCQGCNLGLGHFRDNAAVLMAAVAYLAFWQGDSPQGRSE